MTIKEVLEHKWVVSKAPSRVVEKRKSTKIDGASSFSSYTTTVDDKNKESFFKK